MKRGFNVAIDGPAGAGKSTIAKKVAEKLNYIYLDTGAMYRTIALHCIRKNVNLEDECEVVNACKDVNIDIKFDNGEQQVWLNGENVNGYIRTPEVGKGASSVAAYGPIRKKLVEMQQDIAKISDVIMDGRDIGTCVLKDAQVKIYLTASSKVRAERRYKEFLEKGIEADIDVIEKEIIDRDYHDMHREISPLTKAEDALVLDSSYMTIEEVVEKILHIIGEKIK